MANRLDLRDYGPVVSSSPVCFSCASSTSIPWERTPSRPETGLLAVRGVVAAFSQKLLFGLSNKKQKVIENVKNWSMLYDPLNASLFVENALASGLE
jgi:hypothetical protein